MLILLTNDDGYSATGIRALAANLKKLGRVVIVAPQWEQSGTGHSLTLYRPLRTKKITPDIHAVSGTPTDAVMIAVYCILKKKPDILISGINHGPNMGDDITYSGTVAAAMEGTLLDIPSIAVSLAVSNHSEPLDRKRFTKAAGFTARLARAVIKNGIPKSSLLNVNVPAIPLTDIRGVRITRLGKRIYRDALVELKDPEGTTYYSIGGERPTGVVEEGTDFGSLAHGYVSITPVHMDMTSHSLIEQIRTWEQDSLLD